MTKFQLIRRIIFMTYEMSSKKIHPLGWISQNSKAAILQNKPFWRSWKYRFLLFFALFPLYLGAKCSAHPENFRICLKHVKTRLWIFSDFSKGSVILFFQNEVFNRYRTVRKLTKKFEKIFFIYFESFGTKVLLMSFHKNASLRNCNVRKMPEFVKKCCFSWLPSPEASKLDSQKIWKNSGYLFELFETHSTTFQHKKNFFQIGSLIRGHIYIYIGIWSYGLAIYVFTCGEFLNCILAWDFPYFRAYVIKKFR